MSVEEKKDAPDGSSMKDVKQKKNVSWVSSMPNKNPATPLAASKLARRQPPQQVHNPAKVGRANPKRDIPIFLCLVGLLFLIAYSMSGLGGTNEKQTKKSIKELQEDLLKVIEIAQKKEQERKRTTECGLFIASSSIPGTGLGIFAGKKFQVGEKVVSANVRPTSLELIKSVFLICKSHLFRFYIADRFLQECFILLLANAIQMKPYLSLFMGFC
jgi:hypothetical protein